MQVLAGTSGYSYKEWKGVFYPEKDLPRLEEFLRLLPADPPAAFEFRNASWQDDAVYEALRARAAMICIGERAPPT